MKTEELDAVYRRVIRKGRRADQTIPREDAEFAYLYFAYLFRELADNKAVIMADRDELQQENLELRRENLSLYREIERLKSRRR
jgi:hypothetical protein